MEYVQQHRSRCSSDPLRLPSTGQKRDVLVLRLVCAGTVEEDILDKAAAKRDLDAKVIQVGGGC
jgi:SNF2 family DNA or RNA helicase